jgi:hypothetical protein
MKLTSESATAAAQRVIANAGRDALAFLAVLTRRGQEQPVEYGPLRLVTTTPPPTPAERRGRFELWPQ